MSSSPPDSPSFVTDDVVERTLTMDEAIQVNKDIFMKEALGQVTVPERAKVAIPDAGVTLLKPAFIHSSNASSSSAAAASSLSSSSSSPSSASSGSLGVKVVSVRPPNALRHLPTTPAILLLIDVETGYPTGVMQATFLTALRTAAGSGVATSLLAPVESKSLVVFGAGLQAEQHVRAMLSSQVRGSTIQEVTIINRNIKRAQQVADTMHTRYLTSSISPKFQALAADDRKGVEQAVRGADIIVTATGSSTPLFEGAWLKDKVHINAVGSYMPDTQEVDAETVARSCVVIDSPEALSVGDLAKPLASGKASKNNIVGTLGQLLIDQVKLPELSTRPTRTVTLFKSVGTAMQDVATADAVMRKVKAQAQAQAPASEPAVLIK